MTQSELFEQLSFPIQKIYMQVENDLLVAIMARLKTGIDFTGKTLNWNLNKLHELGGISKDAIKYISKGSKRSKALLGNLMQEIAKGSLKVNGINNEITPGVERVIKALQAQAENHLNLTNTTMYTATIDAYSVTLNKLESVRNWALSRGVTELAVGAKGIHSEIASVVHELADNGITAMVDASGRAWSPEAYVAMNLRTTTAQVAREAIKEQGKDYGLDVILVSSHAGARPGCAPYQGKCFSMSGRRGKIKDVYGREYEFEPIDITGYNPGTGLNNDPAGLFGINCGHTFRYIEEGSFKNNEEPIETEAEIVRNRKEYALSQEQRAIERSIRNDERNADLFKEAGDTAKAKEYAFRATEKRQEYREFCESNDRTPRWERTRIYA